MAEALLERKIKAWEDKLLDMSKRNRMLHFRETKRTTLSLLEPSFDELFHRIAIADEKLTFQRLVDKDSDIRVFAVLSLLEGLSCPIPVVRGDIKAQGSLVERQKTLRNLRIRARLAMDEQGINILYMATGFIEWREKNSDGTWIKSPLVLVPVSLVIESAKAPVSLVKYDDDIVVNPTLSFLFETQYGIKLPAYDPDEDSSISSYFDLIEELISKKGWKVRREISLGLLSFLKINMYKDLKNNGGRMAQNPVLRSLSGERDSKAVDDNTTKFDHDRVPPEKCFQVVDADSSQQDAVLLSQRGVSFVMQGPPGTGKSQTITNMIAQALGEGKKVLFVSEKMAALQVVHKRLEEVHLADFCLPLHSNKANKKEILKMLGDTLRLQGKRVRKDAFTSLGELNIEREKLNRYAADLHSNIEPLQISIYEAYGRFNSLQNSTEISFHLQEVERITDDQMRRMLHVVQEYHAAMQKNKGVIENNSWMGTTIPFISYNLTDDMKLRLEKICTALDAAYCQMCSLDDEGKISYTTTLLNLNSIYSVTMLAKAVFGLPEDWFDSADLDILFQKALDNQNTVDTYWESKHSLQEKYRESYFNIPADSMRDHINRTRERLSLFTDIDSFNLTAITDVHDLCLNITTKLQQWLTQTGQLAHTWELPEPESYDEILRICEVAREVYREPTVAIPWCSDSSVSELNALISEGQKKAKDILILKRKLLGLQEQQPLSPQEEALLEFDGQQGLLPTEKVMDKRFQICRALIQNIIPCSCWAEQDQVPTVRQFVADCKAALIRIETLYHSIVMEYEPEVFEIDYKAIMHRYKTEYQSILRIIKKNYKTDRNLIRSMQRDFTKKVDDTAAIALLKMLRDYHQAQAWVQDNKQNIDLYIGSNYHDLQTDWDSIIRCIDTLQVIEKLRGEQAFFVQKEDVYSKYFGSLFQAEHTDWSKIEADIACISKVRHIVGAQINISPALKEALCEKAWTNESISIDEFPADEELLLLRNTISEILLPQWAAQNNAKQSAVTLFNVAQTCEALQADYMRLGSQAVSDYSPRALYSDLSMLSQVQSVETVFTDDHADFSSCFGSLYRGMVTDWSQIVMGLENAKEFVRQCKSLALPNDFQRKSCCSTVRQDNIEAFLSTAEVALQILPEAEQIQALFDTAWVMQAPICHSLQRLQNCLAHMEDIESAIDYRNCRKACVEIGLASFIEAVEEEHQLIADLPQAFEKAFYRQWLDYQCAHKEAIARFLSRAHDDTVRRFCQLDKLQLQIAQMRIREKLIAELPDEQRLIHSSDELSILRHELGKKSRIMPIRKLFRQIPNLLLRLKPCLMMSPLSVAQFLEAQTYQFDLVIFDEASQIFPEDAIGAILRGAQVVIAGDSKQLPPTNFFTATTNNSDDEYDTEDDDLYDDEVYDSILEEASSKFPQQSRLLWHYRSRSEDLIAFSNQQIYDGELITFPSSINRQPNFGVEYVYVANGVYEGRCNMHEARRCAALVFEHIRKFPDRSLGIIAFSEKQQTAIEDVISRARIDLPQYEWFFDENREAPFFIKNLENVQGDERDTIIFSICYGKNKSGTMYMRFGPLGHPGGERRLNVAITRAKYNVKLVGSIQPQDIDLSRTGAEGVRLLRSYIEYANSDSDVVTPKASSSESEDEFSESIAAYLEQECYHIKRNVGCSSYTIDIAVEHPDFPDRYVAGIECDGNTYVMARTARDRDRIRQSMLESMGWSLYRIWSTDWMRNPISAKKALKDFIDKTIREYKETTPAQKQHSEVEPSISAIVEDAPTITNQTSLFEPHGIELLPYVVANWWDTPNLSNNMSDAHKICSAIRYIVKIEQPIHIEQLYRRMAGLFGREKATKPVRDTVDAALQNRLKADFRHEDCYLSEINGQEPNPRKDGGRGIDMIAPSEISAVMVNVVQNAYGITQDALLVETSKLFGFERQGPKITQAMLAVIDKLQAEKKIRILDEKITLTEEQHG